MAGHLIDTGGNLYIGDDSPEQASMHLILLEATLPELEEKTQTLDASGAVGEQEIGTGKLSALKFPFKLSGINVHAMSQFGLGTGIISPYTYYGELTDDKTGEKQELVGRIDGKMTSAKSDAMKAGELGSGDFEVSNIRYYRLEINGTKIYEYGINPPIWYSGGRDRYAITRSILRIPG